MDYYVKEKNEMAKVILRGIERCDYVSKRTGNPVKGYSLHVNYKDRNITGLKCDTKWLSDDDCHNLQLDVKELEPYLDQWIDLELDFNNRICGITAGGVENA